MRGTPLAALVAWSAALALPLGLAGAAAAGQGDVLWVALHGCARLGALWGALLGLAALALAVSALVAGLGEMARQARVGRRALRAARACAVAPEPGIGALARELGIARLVVCDVPERLAFCTGLLRPRVVLSTAVTAALEADALRALLAHEAAHARRRDPLRQVLAASAARALWIVPALAALAAHGRLRRELAADRDAARRAGERPLAKALLAMHGAPTVPTAAIAGAASDLAARVDALCGASPPPPQLPAGTLARSLLGVGLATALVVALLAAPAASGDPLLAMPMGPEGALEMTLGAAIRAMALVVLWLGVRTVLGRPWRPELPCLG